MTNLAVIQAEWQNIVFYLNIVVLFVILAKWHNDGDQQFDFKTALIDPETNRVSFSRLGHFVSLFISTLIIAFETVNGRLSEWLFAGYMLAWTGAYVAVRAIDKRGDGYSYRNIRPHRPTKYDYRKRPPYQQAPETYDRDPYFNRDGAQQEVDDLGMGEYDTEPKSSASRWENTGY